MFLEQLQRFQLSVHATWRLVSIMGNPVPGSRNSIWVWAFYGYPQFQYIPEDGQHVLHVPSWFHVSHSNSKTFEDLRSELPIFRGHLQRSLRPAPAHRPMPKSRTMPPASLTRLASASRFGRWSWNCNRGEKRWKRMRIIKKTQSILEIYKSNPI